MIVVFYAGMMARLIIGYFIIISRFNTAPHFWSDLLLRPVFASLPVWYSQFH